MNHLKGTKLGYGGEAAGGTNPSAFLAQPSENPAAGGQTDGGAAGGQREEGREGELPQRQTRGAGPSSRGPAAAPSPAALCPRSRCRWRCRRGAALGAVGAGLPRVDLLVGGGLLAGQRVAVRVGGVQLGIHGRVAGQLDGRVPAAVHLHAGLVEDVEDAHVDVGDGLEGAVPGAELGLAAREEGALAVARRPPPAAGAAAAGAALRRRRRRPRCCEAL